MRYTLSISVKIEKYEEEIQEGKGEINRYLGGASIHYIGVNILASCKNCIT
jgi:hypothetical protein